MYEYRIETWRSGDVTTYRLKWMDEIGNIHIDNEEVYTNKAGAQRAKLVRELNEQIHHWKAWDRSRRASRWEFAEAVKDAFGVEIHLFDENGEGKFLIPNTDGIYLAYTWYNYRVEVAYCS
jgi:hypothetical protein